VKSEHRSAQQLKLTLKEGSVGDVVFRRLIS